MGVFDSKRLRDVLIRQQLFAERVKLGQVAQFSEMQRELSEELKDLLVRIQYRTLDGMTKRELNSFLVTLRQTQNRIYTKYTQTLIEQLEAFMAVNKDMTKRILSTLLSETSVPDDDEEPDDSDEADEQMQEQEDDDNGIIPIFGWSSMYNTVDSDNDMWSLIMLAALPANGIMPDKFIKNFSISAQASVENLVRQAYVNGWTTKETIDAIVGTSALGYKDGKMGQVLRQGSAVIDTVTQHVGQNSSGAVQSAYFKRYRWNSIIDAVTTPICLSRAGHTYLFGKGPLPPAHIRCRSFVVPIDDNSYDVPDEPMYNWAHTQPVEVIQAIYGKSVGARIKQNSTAETVDAKLSPHNMMTLDEYQAALKIILTR